MNIKQPQELIEKYNKTLLEHYSNVIMDNHGMNMEINDRMLYTHIYGHNPLYQYKLVELKDTKALKFINYSLSSVSVKDKFNKFSKNYSLIDTAEKLGCVAYPVPNEAIFISNEGLILIGCYGNRIGDTEIKRIDCINLFADSVANIGKLSEHLFEHLVEVNTDNPETSTYLWVRQGYSSSLSTQELEFKRMNIDLEKNYNDDMPYDRIIEKLNSDTKELLLFNGKAGTGKTSLIKHLMGVVDKRFLYIDSSLLRDISSSSFISFLLEFRNSIVVLEDCEKILSKREEGNPFMGTLLNLTDGIIGETVNSKFICSFNCSENKIDEALLRKGRLSLKYTFNELSLDKTRKLVPDAKEGMTLAEIYNKDEENVVNKPVERRIGF